ncbi:MAG TPA: hypothetical protein VD867_12355 [Burkholderiales bacterium]|nr:hypothetical protein [Burkholderiales bacterium]
MKAISAGSEIDAWCTKCKMDLGHRIIALVAGAPKRVVCLTCNGEHGYYAPRNAAPAEGAAVRKRGTNGTAGPPSAKRPATAGVRAAQKAKVEQDRYDGWASRTLGKNVDTFVKYSMEAKLELGQLILHPKFGEGYVEGVREDGKVSVMFRDGPRTLAHRAR